MGRNSWQFKTGIKLTRLWKKLAMAMPSATAGGHIFSPLGAIKDVVNMGLI